MKYLKKFKLFENQVSPEELIPLSVLKRSGLNSKKFYVELQKAIEGKSKEEAKEIAFKLLGYFNIDKITGAAATRGVDIDDLVDVQLSTDGEITYVSEMRIRGRDNAFGIITIWVLQVILPMEFYEFLHLMF